MEKVEAMIDSVKDEFAEVKTNLLSEKAKIEVENSEEGNVYYDLDSEKVLGDANKAKVLFTNSQLTEEEIPDCIRQLHNHYNFNITFDELISADELAVLSGASRQTILNYANSGILKGQKKLGDKTIYFNFKESIVPLFYQLMTRRTQEEIELNEINIICLYKDIAERDKYIQAIKSKYSVVDSAESLVELVELTLKMPTDRAFTANKAIDYAEDLIEKESKDIEQATVLKKTKSDDEMKKDYTDRLLSFFDTLSKVDFSTGDFKITAEDVKPVLKEMATIQAMELSIKKNARTNINKGIKTDKVKKRYAYKTEIGEDFEKLYVRALKTAMGNNVRKTLYRTLLSEHVMLNMCELSEDFAMNMMSIEKTIKSMHPSYRTIIMGYSSLDNALKAYIDAKCNSLKELNSEYLVTTM